MVIIIIIHNNKNHNTSNNNELLQQQGRLRAATFQIVHHLLRSLLNAQCSAAALEGGMHTLRWRGCVCVIQCIVCACGQKGGCSDYGCG